MPPQAPPSRRVAVLNDGRSYVGPALARLLAERGHDLVIGDPADGLVAELEGVGAKAVAVEGVAGLRDEAQAERLVGAATEAFGRIDSAAVFSGRIIGGRFVRSSVDDLHALVRGCLEAPYHFLKAVVPVLTAQREGQVLVITSAAGAKPVPGAPLYSTVRAAATMLARNVAVEVARTGVQVNAVGTNFMDFPEFVRATGADTPEGLERVLADVPLGRLGTLEEFASFCMPFLDGSSRFTTGQFVAYAGGWA